MLQATFATEAGAEAFWGAAVPLMAMLSEAPGMIRRYSFPDGPSITLLALWRSLDDAKAFAATPEHRAAVRDLHRQRWQYSHFSALWELHHTAGRQFFCEVCDEVTGGPATTCAGCGAALVDTYA
jgi:heme-degrading monooxygenase HmoA